MKDYKKWHDLKTTLEAVDFKDSEKHTKPMFRERDIWWCSLGENIGYEQDGKNENYERPVLILKKFSQDMFLGVPLTSSEKLHPLRYPYDFHEKNGAVNLTQARTLSVKRLHRRMGTMIPNHFEEIITLFSSMFTTEKAKTPIKSG